jgi:hypothetical protein
VMQFSLLSLISLLGPGILLSTLFSSTLSLYSSLTKQRTKFYFSWM